MAAVDPQSVAVQGFRFEPLHIAEQGLVAALTTAEVICAAHAALQVYPSVARGLDSGAAVASVETVAARVAGSQDTAVASMDGQHSEARMAAGPDTVAVIESDLAQARVQADEAYSEASTEVAEATDTSGSASADLSDTATYEARRDCPL